MRAIVMASILILLPIVGCSFQAYECCDCMATKSTLFGDCLTDSYEVCIQELSKSPPNVDTVSGFCRSNGEDGLCATSCADILYKD